MGKGRKAGGVDLSKFGSVVKGLSKISGASFADVIKAEAGHILSNAMSRTKKGSVPKVVKYFMPVNQKYLRSTGKKEAFTIKQGQFGAEREKTYRLRYKIPNDIWNHILTWGKDRTKKRSSKIGMSAAQWAVIAKQLGIVLPKKTPRNVSKFLNNNQGFLSSYVAANARGKKKSYTIEFETRLKKNKFTGAGRAIRNSVKGRITNFTNAIKKDLFKDMKFRTSRYPLLFSR